jgi:hypothetical protein
MIRRTRLLTALSAVLFLPVLFSSAPALAQTPPSNLRGTVDSFSNSVLQMTLRGGDKITVAVPAGIRVTETVPASADDIKSDSYIGCTSIDRNGQEVALEVHIFPAAARGTGDGSRPYDLQPNSTMTNGAVGAVQDVNGHAITIDYKGGKKTVLVTPETKVVTFAAGSLSDLTPGAHIIASSTKGADGSWTAQRLSVGKDGSIPPM